MLKNINKINLAFEVSETCDVVCVVSVTSYTNALVLIELSYKVRNLSLRSKVSHEAHDNNNMHKLDVCL